MLSRLLRSRRMWFNLLNYSSHLQQLSTTPTEILAVQSFPAYHSCCQCKKKIILEKSTVITCNICDVKQKVKSTTEQCYIDINAAKVTVTLLHDIIKNLLISQGKHGLPIDEDNVTSLFLKLLTLSSSRKAVAKTVKTEQQNKHFKWRYDPCTCWTI